MHDNICFPGADMIQQTIGEIILEVLPHAADSPGLSTSDDQLFCLIQHASSDQWSYQIKDIKNSEELMESKLELFFYERSCNLAKNLVKDKRIL